MATKYLIKITMILYFLIIIVKKLYIKVTDLNFVLPKKSSYI